MELFWEIIVICTENPTALMAVLLSLGLMLVNGWTDAPVNIATAIRSGAVSPKNAILTAAVCNFLGAAAMGLLGSSVAVGVYSISGLGSAGDNALCALIAAVFSVVLWSLVALRFGLPTSESHALFAGLTGSGIALQGLSAVNGAEWLKVLLGIALSTLPVAVLAYLAARLLKALTDIPALTFKRLQLLGAMLSSFAHGAQDGQKFAGILTLAAVLGSGVKGQTVAVPLWTAMVSAAVISLGTLIGGKRIIKRFGSLAPKDPAAGFASDLVSAVVLTVLSAVGLPASTTHAKSSAVIGAGRFDAQTKQDTATLRSMVLAWVLTFPISAALGFIITKILT